MYRYLAVLCIFGTSVTAHPTASVYYTVVENRVTIDATGGATKDTPFAIASIGKMFTSVAVLKAQEAGLLKVDDLARVYLPVEIVENLGGLDDVTLRHLLTMTSGIAGYYDEAFLSDALEDPDSVATPDQAVSYAYGKEPLFAPGRGFDYSNTNYLLLGMILEKVFGASYAQILDHQVLSPAGMTHSFVFGPRPLPSTFPKGHDGWQHVRDYYTGTGFGDGGVIASAADLHLFFEALLVEKTLLSPGSLAQMITPPDGSRYAFGIIDDDPVLWHNGGDVGFSSLAGVNPDTGDIAIALSAKSDADLDWVFEALD